jgi:hypothetical protein
MSLPTPNGSFDVTIAVRRATAGQEFTGSDLPQKLRPQPGERIRMRAGAHRNDRDIVGHRDLLLCA